MFYLKISPIIIFTLLFSLGCNKAAPPASAPVGDNKSYAASLFRQNCAICHGQDGNGKTLEDGKVIPSLRQGDFKFKTEEQIYKQIADGGNGMLPFRNQLTDREIRLLTTFVLKDLRGSP